MSPDIIAKILKLCDYADASHGVTIRTIAAEIRAALEPTQEEAPCPWRWEGDHLYVDGNIVGSVGTAGGQWVASGIHPGYVVMPDERTARAVVVALAGFDPGVTFVLKLRPDWTREDIDAARNHDLGRYVAGMLEGYAEDFDGQQHEDDPAVVRAWWAGGYKALNLSAKDRDDDCPF